jgi:3-deoxy-D-manno-octulosonic-acid transferase
MPDRGLAWGLYDALTGAACAALPLAAPFSAKLRAGLEGRRGLTQRMQQAAGRLRGCVWFHVTSVGEYEQARPVIAALQEGALGTAPPIAVTHFSPSGFSYARKRPAADFHDYLPLDRLSAMRTVVRLWRPRLLVFVKFDCWPNLVIAAGEQHVPVVLIAGTLQPTSARLWPAARPLFRDLYNRFTHLGVCTEQDRDRFIHRLDVRRPVTVTGDTRAEQVILRYDAAARGRVFARLAALGGRLLILGSTWPPDEQLWLPVLAELLGRFADLRVVLVPHEPTHARLQQLQGQLTEIGVPTISLSQLLAEEDSGNACRCVLVDSIGVLAETYRAGTLAYVGGSFTSGVHNTMEPAVAGLPVLFGPVIRNAAEAQMLVSGGAAFVLNSATEALQRTRALLERPEDLARRGQVARQTVLGLRGATQKSLAVLARYL